MKREPKESSPDSSPHAPGKRNIHEAQMPKSATKHAAASSKIAKHRATAPQKWPRSNCFFLWLAAVLSGYSPILVYTVWKHSPGNTTSPFSYPRLGVRPIQGSTVVAPKDDVQKVSFTKVGQVKWESSTPISFRNRTIPSRVWNKFQGEFPCYKGQTKLMIQEPAHEGLLFQRPMKVGSTTMVSVVLRLAHNRSPWFNKTDSNPNNQVKCIHRSMHGDALGLEYDKRNRKKSFLFSLIRHPTKRAISEFFHFHVSFRKVEPTDRNFVNYLTNPNLENRYLYDLRVTNYTRNTTAATKSFLNMHKFANETEMQMAFAKRRLLLRRYNQHMKIGTTPLTKVVQDILDGYDFIAVTERMDESLVAMQMLLNLTTKDILYIRARSSESFSNGLKKTPCIYIQPSFLTHGVMEYFASSEWQHTIRGDLLLYLAANASLDRTIESVGKEDFRQNLNALKVGLVLADEHCKGRVRSSCSEGGAYIPAANRTCYVWGEACDHECLNDLILPP